MFLLVCQNYRTVLISLQNEQQWKIRSYNLLSARLEWFKTPHFQSCLSIHCETGVGRWMEWQASTSTSLLLLLEMGTTYTYTTVPFIEPESDHCLTMSVYLLTHCPIPRNWHHKYLHNCSIFDISLYFSPQKIHQAYDQFHLDTQNFQKKI